MDEKKEPGGKEPQPEVYLHRLILELLDTRTSHELSAKASEIAGMMPSEHRQKLIDLGYMAIQSSDTPAVWWTYLFELADTEEGHDRLIRLRDMIDRRLKTGDWL